MQLVRRRFIAAEKDNRDADNPSDGAVHRGGDTGKSASVRARMVHDFIQGVQPTTALRDQKYPARDEFADLLTDGLGQMRNT